jgi:hypothetical protein
MFNGGERMRRMYLEPNDVPSRLRGVMGYSGRKFQANITTEVTFTGTNWSGGSRSRYTAVRLADGECGKAFGGSDMPAPWSNPVEGKTVEIPAGVVIVEHCLFQGKDLGLTFYVRPENASAMLPESGDSLPRDSQIVLAATAGLKSFARFSEASYETKITQDRYDAAKAELIVSGHLRKNGSITPKGRNTIGDVRLFDLRESV